MKSPIFTLRPVFAWRWLALLFVACLVPNLAYAAPYAGDVYTYHQPNGETFQIRLWGDEFFAYQETEDGYLVIRDPQTGFFCYAKISADGSDIVSTGVRVGREKPAGLKPRLRLAPVIAFEKSRIMRDLYGKDAKGRLKPELRKKFFGAKKGHGKKDEGEANDGIRFSPDDGEAVFSDEVQFAPPTASTTGKRAALVLLASFPDRPGDISKTPQQIDMYCNDPAYMGDGNATSVYGYFHKQSNGKLEYTNVVTAWFEASRDRGYYADNALSAGPRARELINEGLAALSAGGFDFSRCDANNDNVLDGVNLFYAGARVNDWAKGLWPHQASSTWSGFSDHGISTGFQYQVTDMPTSLGIGTFCHESAHMILDYPDLYSQNGNPADVGLYCLMHTVIDKHPNHFSPYLKIASGWSDVVDLTSTSSLRGVVHVDRNHFYRFKNPSRNSESFIIEVRHGSGYEGVYGGAGAVQPTSGLAVYHSLSTGSNTDSTIRTNGSGSYSTPFELMLVEASPTSAVTPWYLDPTPTSADGFRSSGVSALSDSTHPNLNFWTTTGRTLASDAIIHSISASGPTMSFTVGADPVTGPAAIGVTAGYIQDTVEAGANAGSQQFAVFNKGAGTINYTVEDDVPWLAADVATGSVTDAEIDVLTLSFTTSALAVGTHGGTITISASGLSSVAIPVTIIVGDTAAAPVMVLNPSDVHLLGGQSHTLTSNATGSPCPSYQWYKNGNVISGAASENFVIPSASAADAGTYHVIAYNYKGQATSSSAVVTVNDRPSIQRVTPVNVHSVIPQNSSVLIDTTVSDDGYGGSSLTYEWSVVSAPDGGVVTWSDQNGPDTTVSFSAVGSYQLRLGVSDGVNTTTADYYFHSDPGVDPVDSSDLIVRYPFDETSGITAADSVGTQQDAALLAGAGFSDGELVLNGTSTGRATIASSTEIDSGGPYPKRTITAWVKRNADTVASQFLYEQGGGTTGMSLLFAQNNTVMCRNWRSSGSVFSQISKASGSIAPNSWFHIAAVLDAPSGATTLQAGALRVYINGQMLVSGNGVPMGGDGNGIGLGGINSVSRISSSSNGSGPLPLPGRIDDFRIYNRALSVDEVGALYHASNMGPSVNAGGPYNGMAEVPLALDGAVSDDGQPGPPTLVTQWAQVSGPATVVFGNPAAVDTTFTADVPGTYVLRLTANDGLITTYHDVSCALTSPSGPGYVKFDSAGFTASESSQVATLAVRRLGGADGAVSVAWQTVEETAGSASDFISTSGVLSWTDQESGLKTIQIPLVDDFTNEANETFTVNLNSPGGGATITSPSSATVTITDTDQPPYHRMPITYSNLEGRGTLANFPVLVKLTPENTNNYAGFLDTANGWDLRFWTNAERSGGELSYEIESFDSSGTSCIWVKVPALSQGATIWATWGDPTYNSQPAYATNGSVWSDAFAGVWHLDEVNGVEDLSDATANNNDADQDSDTANVAGLIGKGQEFDGGSDSIRIPDSTSLSITGSITLEAWCKPTSLDTAMNLISKDGNNAYRYRIQGGGGTLWSLVNDGSGFETDSVAHTFSTNVWQHVVVVMDMAGDQVRYYVNGQLVGSPQTLTKNSIANTTGTLVLGNYLVGRADEDFAGVLDEVRISNGVRSADWIWACAANQGAGHDTFQNYGTPEMTDGGSLKAPGQLAGVTQFNPQLQVTLAWNDNNDVETGFVIERSSSSGSGYAMLHATGADVTTYADKAVAIGSNYYYRVRATNGTQVSAASNEIYVNITKLPATVTLGGLSHTYDGTAKSASVSTDPAGLAVDVTYNDGSSPPVNAGLYAVAAVITDSTHEGSLNALLTIAEATPTVNAWPVAAAINEGNPLSAATLSGGSASVPGTFAYESPATLPPDGSYTANVLFIPADAVNYHTVAGTVSVTVNHAVIHDLVLSTKSGSGGTSGHIQYNSTSSFGVAGWHVKNTDLSGSTTRKGCVRIDTSYVTAPVTQASLELVVSTIDSTIGDADQTLYLYGVTDEALDNVALVNDLTWADAPANNTTSAHAADLSKAALLGTVLVDYNGNNASPVGTVVSFGGQALEDFLNADTNGKVTFILGRTGTSDDKNLLFAGELHETLAAPQLRLQMNHAPAFISNPLVAPDGVTDLAYGGTLAASVTDDDGDELTFSKVSVPAWLTVAADGSLTGTPGASDVGLNSFTVSVTDGIETIQTTLQITVLSGFSSFMANPAYGIPEGRRGFADDPDGDGLANGLESLFGTHPGQPNAAVTSPITNSTTTTFNHPINADLPTDVTSFYEWSPDLTNWYDGNGLDGPVNGTRVMISTQNNIGTTTVSATANQPLSRIFLRVGVKNE